MYNVTNPATGEVLAEYATATDKHIFEALDLAAKTFKSWKFSNIKERSNLLYKVADLYYERRDELAHIITREMGKPVQQAKGEIDIVISIYRYYAEHGQEFLKDEKIDVISGGTAIVRKEGLGVLLGIMPWNYPYYQVARFAAPNIMNGNAILLKHAPQCPESALAMEQIFVDAGAPRSLYVNIFATNEQVADIIADPRIAGVSLTGSERAGSAVAEIAGRNLKKVVLELGGSDPFLVLNNADVAMAAKQAMVGRFGNTGQACNAAKRIIVDSSVYEEFVEKFTAAVADIKVGDPADTDTFMGPLSSVEARENISAQVQDAVEKGATVLAGARTMEGKGAWYMPTILADVKPGMRAYKEEIFGPVAVIYKVSGVGEAVKLANSSAYGLSASVQTDDMEQAVQIASKLESGMIFVNQPSGTAADLPFGGIKRSGVGRELGKYGMDEFVNKKLVKLN